MFPGTFLAESVTGPEESPWEIGDWVSLRCQIVCATKGLAGGAGAIQGPGKTMATKDIMGRYSFLPKISIPGSM